LLLGRVGSAAGYRYTADYTNPVAGPLGINKQRSCHVSDENDVFARAIHANNPAGVIPIDRHLKFSLYEIKNELNILSVVVDTRNGTGNG
jgi:hypothetical protein